MQISQHEYINAHTHHATKTSEVQVLNTFADDLLPEILPNIYFSSGIHPWYLDNWEIKVESLLQKVRDPKVIAIGECGLDTYSDFPKDLQKKVFCLQVEYSETFKKPMIIHCVKSFHDLFQIHKMYRCTMPWIIHGFTGSIGIVEKCISEGMLLSFGKHLFTENSHAFQLAKNIPLSQVLLETDESQLTISDIYSKFSEIQQIGIVKLKETIAANFSRCFLS
jgi:TatD DNase family protein